MKSDDIEIILTSKDMQPHYILIIQHHGWKGKEELEAIKKSILEII